MLRYGGYPEAWLADNPERVLGDLKESFVMRDASDRFRIQKVRALRILLQLAAGQVGQMVNFSEWAGLAGISMPTAQEYLHVLEETWILHLLPPFAGGRRREITGAPRVHFYDPGLRNAVLGAFGPDLETRSDRGALYEAVAFAELVKVVPRDWVLHYWRSVGGGEVDLVLARGQDLIAVEVKAGANERLRRGGRSFIDAYEPWAFIIVTSGMTLPRTEHIDETTVLRVALTDLARTVLTVI
jgi:predicted AAA+ superfamily ATPase